MSNGNGNDEDVPGIGIDGLKRRPVDSLFETSLSVAQCRAILAATRRHEVNFRPMMKGGTVELLVETMKRDLWVWTDSDPIRLHLDVPSGEVVCTDGQHRLYAAVRARRVLHTLVLWGDKWKAGVHVDRNKTRNVAQYLQHEHGIGSASVYASVTRMHLARVAAVSEGLSYNYSRNRGTNDETVIDFVVKNRERLQWAISHGAAASKRGFSMSGYAVMLYELATISDDLATQFHDDMLNDDLDPQDPLAALRRAVGRRYNDTGIRSSVAFTVNNLVKAHNLRSAGDTVSRWVNVQSDEVVLPAGFKLNEQPKGANQ